MRLSRIDTAIPYPPCDLENRVLFHSHWRLLMQDAYLCSYSTLIKKVYHDAVVLATLDLISSCNSVDDIQGRISFFGEADGGHIAVFDSNDLSGDNVHVTPSELGAAAGDTLFGPGGALVFNQLVNYVDGIGLRLFLGSGSDRVAVAPHPLVTIAVHGASPTSTPGDALQVVLNGVSTVFTPTGIGAGTYTFTGAQPITFTGFESAESAVPGDLNADGADAADLFANWEGSGTGDLNGDGIVDAADAGILFGNWTGDGAPQSVANIPPNRLQPLVRYGTRLRGNARFKAVDAAFAQL